MEKQTNIISKCSPHRKGKRTYKLSVILTEVMLDTSQHELLNIQLIIETINRKTKKIKGKTARVISVF